MPEEKAIEEQETKQNNVVFSNDLLEGSVTKNIIHLALPVLAANFLANAYNIVDMIFVGRLGPEALAAVSMGGILMSFTWTMLVGLAIGTSSFIARFYGAKNDKKVSSVITQTIILGGTISWILALFGFFGAESSLALLGAEGRVLELGTVYTRIIFCCSFNLIFLFVINSMFRGTGDTKTPMITLGISSIINLILDPLLIFGLGPFPELGVKGAAIATVVGQGIGAALNFYILFKGKSRIRLSNWTFIPDFGVLRSIFKVSVPASIQMLIQTISGLILMKLVSSFGTEAVAAFGVCLRLDIMVNLPGWAIGASVATILGQNLGAKQPERAEKTGWHGVRIYFVILSLLCLSLWLGATYVISAFNSEPAVVAVGAEYIRIVAIGYIFQSVALILTMSMNGAGYTIAPMLIILVSFLGFRIPAALTASYVFDMGTKGLWYAIAASLMLQAILNTIWFKKGRWKFRKMH